MGLWNGSTGLADRWSGVHHSAYDCLHEWIFEDLLYGIQLESKKYIGRLLKVGMAYAIQGRNLRRKGIDGWSFYGDS